MCVAKIDMILAVDGQHFAQPKNNKVTSATSSNLHPDPPRPPPALILEHVLAMWKLWTGTTRIKSTHTTLVDHIVDNGGKGGPT